MLEIFLENSKWAFAREAIMYIRRQSQTIKVSLDQIRLLFLVF